MHGKVLLGAGFIFVLTTAVFVHAADTNAPSASKPADEWAKIKADFESLQTLQSDDEAKKLLPKLEGETKRFFTKFPDDPHAANATMLWAQLGQSMNAHDVAGGPSDDEIEQTFEKLATDAKVPKEKRAEIRIMQISEAVNRAVQSNNAADWDEAEKRFEIFDKQFGSDYSLDGQQQVEPDLRAQELRMLSENPDAATRYNALIKKLAASSNPQLKAVAEAAQDEQKNIAELKTKPLNLKFTAVDGREVDLAKLRGKVVLVDFWATWCPPCRAEMPGIVAAYEKYHAKGFEIVGISLDQEKDTMQKFTKEMGMAWPQYFDGKGWDNAISSRYGIFQVPAQWLVDKKGMVIETSQDVDLAAELPKLLAAP